MGEMVITSIRREIDGNSRIPKTLSGIAAKVQRTKNDKHRQILANHIWFRLCDHNSADMPEMQLLKSMATYARDEYIDTESIVEALIKFGFSEAYAINATNSIVQSEINQKKRS